MPRWVPSSLAVTPKSQLFKFAPEPSKATTILYILLAGSVIEPDPQKVDRFELQPIIVNTGQTPAYDVKYHSQVCILQFQLPQNFDYPLPPSNPEESITSVGPQQRFILFCA